jgi:hypothetical protein
LIAISTTFAFAGIAKHSFWPAIKHALYSSSSLIPIQRPTYSPPYEIRLARFGFGIGIGFGIGGGGIVGGYVGIPSGRGGVYINAGPGLNYPYYDGYYHSDFDRGAEYIGKSGNPDYWDWSKDE